MIILQCTRQGHQSTRSDRFSFIVSVVSITKYTTTIKGRMTVFRSRLFTIFHKIFIYLHKLHEKFAGSKSAPVVSNSVQCTSCPSGARGENATKMLASPGTKPYNKNCQEELISPYQPPDRQKPICSYFSFYGKPYLFPKIFPKSQPVSPDRPLFLPITLTI